VDLFCFVRVIALDFVKNKNNFQLVKHVDQKLLDLTSCILVYIDFKCFVMVFEMVNISTFLFMSCVAQKIFDLES
jgi:hypothetical protein